MTTKKEVLAHFLKLNRDHPARYILDKRYYFGPIETMVIWRHKDLMGRFGYGVRFKLGIEIHHRSIVFNLLTGYVRISWLSR